MVVRMPDENMDPSGNTAQFRAFVSEPEPATGAARHTGVIAAAAVLAVIAIALIIWAFV